MSTLIRKVNLKQRGININDILDENIARNYPLLFNKLKANGFFDDAKSSKSIRSLFA